MKLKKEQNKNSFEGSPFSGVAKRLLLAVVIEKNVQMHARSEC